MEINAIETPVESTKPTKKFSLYAKIGLWVLGIFIFGVTTFFAANFYENYNDCTFRFSLHGDLEMKIYGYFDARPLSGSKGRTPLNYFRCQINSVYYDRDIGPTIFKPLILLYPQKNQEVQVVLTYAPGFSATFPEYSEEKKGWSVTAYPDATLLDHSTGQETYGLFWEGNAGDTEYDLSKGWVVKGSEAREFLYHKLTKIGLNTKEKSDFIMYWYPKLQEYPYVQITFAGDEYTESAPLEITPKPDSLLRVFMVARPLDRSIIIEPQTLERFVRTGFTTVEWGGTILE